MLHLQGRFPWKRPLISFLIAISAPTLFGQTSSATASPSVPAFTSVPAINSVTLYYAFFQYHENLIVANQAAKADNPTQSSILDQQMATTLGVSSADLSAVVANTQAVIQAYANLASKMAAATSSLTTQQAGQFEFERTHITIEGVRTLWQGISPASWAGIHNFILGPFSTQINKTP
jgi:hypothetical protein